MLVPTAKAFFSKTSSGLLLKQGVSFSSLAANTGVAKLFGATLLAGSTVSLLQPSHNRLAYCAPGPATNPPPYNPYAHNPNVQYTHQPHPPTNPFAGAAEQQQTNLYMNQNSANPYAPTPVQQGAVRNDDDDAFANEAPNGARMTVKQAVVLKFCFGGAFGLFLGHALRRIGRVVAAFLGLNILMWQALVIMKWVKINWKKIGNDLFSGPRASWLARTVEGISLLFGLGGGGFLGFHYTVPITKY
eukprot:GDKI01026196.1.p1 GENE.GDKI01026196.1~~GDKI01026196.1.p1  ORF type:complete len:245 (+),score=34.96 GDKI01026196.1:70-804(+)